MVSSFWLTTYGLNKLNAYLMEPFHFTKKDPRGDDKNFRINLTVPRRDLTRRQKQWMKRQEIYKALGEEGDNDW